MPTAPVYMDPVGGGVPKEEDRRGVELMEYSEGYIHMTGLWYRSGDGVADGPSEELLNKYPCSIGIHV